MEKEAGNIENTIYELKDLYDKKEYDRIIEIASNKKENEILSKWQYFYYTLSLNKKGKFEECLDCIKECKKEYPNFTNINNTMCWALYHDKIKMFAIETGSIDELFEIVDYALKHCKPEKYSPYELILIKTLDIIYKHMNSIDYKLGLRYLLLIEPSQLSDKEWSINVDGKDRKQASRREKWYQYKILTLQKLEEYEQCIEMVDNAFIDIKKFHYNNNQWFRYRKAICHYQIGDLDIAKDILNKILETFPNENFYALLFKIYRDKEDQEMALKYASMAALFNREHDKRVNLYFECAEYLNSLGNYEESMLHVKFVEFIRQEEGWREDKRSKEYKIDDEIDCLSKKEVNKRLDTFWQKNKYANQRFIKGEVKTILKNGKSGFITDDKNTSYYFQFRDFIERINEVKIGQKVEFIATEKVDPKDNVSKPNATEIKKV